MEKFRASPVQSSQELQTNGEYWQEKTDTKEQLLDAATIGLLVIGLRAFIEPERYGDSDFIKNAVGTARMFGYITDEGIQAPAELLDVAYPSGQVRYNQ